MILYTEYCPMSVFICVSLLVSFRCRSPANIEDGTLCDNNYRQFFILSGDSVERTVSSYEHFVFCVSSLLSPSRHRWLQLVPGSSR